MKNWKRFLALALFGAMTLSLFGCNTTLQTTNGDPSADPSFAVSVAPDASTAPEIEVDLSQNALEFSAGLSPTDVMLTINGVDIQADLFCYLLGQACGQMQQNLYYYGMSLSDLPDMADSLLEQGVQLSLYHALIRQKAAELGCLLTDEQTADIEEALNEEGLADSAALWALTDEGTQFILEMNYYYENLYNAVTHDPSADELNDYLYRVKHILLKTVDDSRAPLPEDQIAEKKTQAEELLAQLQAADDLSAKFDELMNEFSEDGRSEEDNTLLAPDGYLAAPGEMVTAFETASKALKEGELSDIVESEFGYHIILRLPTDVTEEERAEQADNYRMNMLEDQMDQWLDEAETTRADALSGLNAVDFYVRLAAYQQKLYDQQQADAPAESDAVG